MQNEQVKMPTPYELGQMAAQNETAAGLKLEIAQLEFARSTGNAFARDSLETWKPEEQKTFVAWLQAHKPELLSQIAGAAIMSFALQRGAENIADQNRLEKLQTRLEALQ